MQHTKGHQERGVHCDLWVQRLMSSKSFQVQVHRHQLPPMEEICQVCQAVKWKMKQQVVAAIAEKLFLHRCVILLNSSNICLKTHFVFKVRSYNGIFLYMSMGASLTENARIDEKLTNLRQGVYIQLFSYTNLCTCIYIIKSLKHLIHLIAPTCFDTQRVIIREVYFPG
jgi:hypothetical protein